MNKKDFIFYKKWFYTYADSFLTSDKDFNYHIILKKEHSQRVSEEIVLLGNSLNLDTGDLILAELIGLYHDLGRFQQYASFHTFFDQKSRDHATLGREIVVEKNIFADLNIKERNIILSCISLHNKLSLNTVRDSRELFFLKLLRDADKLDIWQVLIDHYLSENKNRNPVLLDLPDDPHISDKVVKAFYQQKLIKKEHIKTVNDFIILNISWVFDLNFSYTAQEVIKRNYINTLTELLPPSEQTRTISDIATLYLEEFNMQRV
ncbi:MAG: HD domain-containing protein [bacterium]